MSKDAILRDHDGTLYSYDNLTTLSWLNGHLSGLKEVAVYLGDLACEMFRNGQDKDAVVLRNLAKNVIDVLGPRMQGRAAKHEAEHPVVVKPARLRGPRKKP